MTLQKFITLHPRGLGRPPARVAIIYVYVKTRPMRKENKKEEQGSPIGKPCKGMEARENRS